MNQNLGLLLRGMILLPVTGCSESAGPGAAERVASVAANLPVAFERAELDTILTLSPLLEPPADPTNRVAGGADAALLGQFLFYDERLSANGEISCATCHDPEQGWGDAKPLMEGLATGVRNSPTLWNVAFNRWFFWDGRADSLWAQALFPLESATEMGATRIGLTNLIAQDPGLRRSYEGVFGPLPAFDADPLPAGGCPEGTTEQRASWERLSAADRARVDGVFASIGKALAAFERRIVSRDAPFDAFVAALRAGDEARADVLSLSALRGLKLFVGRGQCTLCHSGPNLTDGEFHNIGLAPGADLPVDGGRFHGVPIVRALGFNGLGAHSDDTDVAANRPVRYVAQKPSNLGEFKTPSLRNVADTAPYMHDGRFASLRDVVRFYSLLDQDPALGHREESLLLLDLSATEVDDLVAFLESLTGQPLAPELLRQPSL